MNLANIREQQNCTQQDLAEQVGITRQMISAIENGATPSVSTAKKIASILKFDWKSFFPDDAEPTG